MSKTKTGKVNRTKGHNAERHYASIFKEMREEFKHCKTSRLASRLHDNAGIDLVFLPFNVQVKAGFQKGLNPSKELKYIQDQMAELFPESSVEHNLPKVLIHYKQVGQGNKRTPYDELVFMTFEDFTKLIQKVEKW